MEVNAKIMFLRSSPRKLKLVADLVRGKKIAKAFVQLETMPQAAARPILKLLRSAEANARHNNKFSQGDLWVSRIEIGQGPTLKRWRPAARGSAHSIHRPTAHVKLVLSDTKPMSSKRSKK